MQNKFQNPELTAEQQNLYNTIIALQSLIESATLNTAEMSQYTDMTYAKKKKLVSEIYFKDKTPYYDIKLWKKFSWWNSPFIFRNL